MLILSKKYCPIFSAFMKLRFKILNIYRKIFNISFFVRFYSFSILYKIKRSNTKFKVYYGYIKRKGIF